MRLIYLYVSSGSAAPHGEYVFDVNAPATNGFANLFLQEGFCYLWDVLLYEEVLDEVLVFVESARGCGHRMIKPKYNLYVIPHIREVHRFIKPGDIIFCRGGFKAWHDVLVELKKREHWLLFYRAASNRGAWPFWDVVLDDLIDKPFTDPIGRNYIPFNKPLRPDLFGYQPFVEKKYDVMVGASHIHDKKGQWRTINALLAYRELYRDNLKCIMPGRSIGGEETRKMYYKIDGLNVECPGMLSRQALNTLYNQTRLYVHMATAGQNDRGPMEAMTCKVPVVIGYPQYHPPWMKECCWIPENPEDYKSVARLIKQVLSEDPKPKLEMYQRLNRFPDTTLPQMKKLFSIIRDSKSPEGFMDKWTSTSI